MDCNGDSTVLPVAPAALVIIQTAEERLPDIVRTPPALTINSAEADDEGELRLAMQYPPFERLPRVFVPRKSMAIKPPVFHYGWPVVWQKLLAFAEAHALTGTFFSVMIKLPPGAHDPDGDYAGGWTIPWDPFMSRPLGPDDDDYFLNEKGIRVPSNTEGAVLWSHPREGIQRSKAFEVHAYTSWFRGLRMMLDYLKDEEHLELDTSRLKVIRRLNPEGGESHVLSLFTNFHLESQHTFTAEKVKRLGEAVGATGAAKWYLDIDHYRWRPWDDARPKRR